jgi:hypothetical protein
MEEQSYAKHTKWVPGFHFFLGPLILLSVILSLVNVFRRFHIADGRTTIVLIALNSIALMLLFYFARTFAMGAQDRAIRAEENLRHYALTGKLLDHRLNMKQIIALRFASDAEFPDLARKAADQGLPPAEIKQAVKHWRPDYDRA